MCAKIHHSMNYYSLPIKTNQKILLSQWSLSKPRQSGSQWKLFCWKIHQSQNVQILLPNKWFIVCVGHNPLVLVWVPNVLLLLLFDRWVFCRFRNKEGKVLKCHKSDIISILFLSMWQTCEHIQRDDDHRPMSARTDRNKQQTNKRARTHTYIQFLTSILVWIESFRCCLYFDVHFY